jgi:hypothetical protein
VSLSAPLAALFRSLLSGLFVATRLSILAAPPNKAQGRIVEIETHAAASPIVDVIDQPGASGVARHPEDNPAIRTGNRLNGHP